MNQTQQAVNQTQPAVSTTATNGEIDSNLLINVIYLLKHAFFLVRTIPAAGLIKQPLTSTLTSATTTEPMREAVLTKEKGILCFTLFIF